jgi:hypothetical protein
MNMNAENFSLFLFREEGNLNDVSATFYDLSQVEKENEEGGE